jgi:hypothetical protein
MRRKRSNFEVELSIYANMTDNSYLTTVGETDLNIVKHQSHDVFDIYYIITSYRTLTESSFSL